MVPSDFEWPLSPKATQRLARVALAPAEWLCTTSGGVLTFATILILVLRDNIHTIRTSYFLDRGSAQERNEKEVLRKNGAETCTNKESLGGGSVSPPDITGKDSLDTCRRIRAIGTELSILPIQPETTVITAQEWTEIVEDQPASPSDIMVLAAREALDSQELEKVLAKYE
jgi:hypothetical protein